MLTDPFPVVRPPAQLGQGAFFFWNLVIDVTWEKRDELPIFMYELSLPRIIFQGIS
jgi:hypothetical protein